MINQFKDWVVGSAKSESTFKDLIDSLKNNLVAGSAFLVLLKINQAPEWAKLCWFLVKPFMALGFLIFLVLSMLQIFFLVERLPMAWAPAQAKWRLSLQLLMFVFIVSVLMAIAFSGWTIVPSI